MSLINQMLRDLQQQKKDGAPPGFKSPRRSMMEKIPYLPLPVVLGGGGVLLLVLIWWMAGALSDMMFGFEPANPSAESQQVAAIEETVTQAELNPPFAKDQLTLAEREAEQNSGDDSLRYGGGSLSRWQVGLRARTYQSGGEVFARGPGIISRAPASQRNAG